MRDVEDASRLLVGIAGALVVALSVGACGPAGAPGLSGGDGGRPTSVRAAATDPGRPGATDPGLSFAKWPDDEMVVIGPPLTGGQSLEVWEPDLAWVYTGTTIPTLDAYAAVAGRFVSAENDSIVRAYRNPATTRLEIAGPGASWTAPLMPRVAGSTDFFDIAAADLDGAGMTDADGNVERHDELVIAHMPSDKFVQISVLGFAPGLADPYVSTVAYATAPPQTTYTANNVVSVTTGDFDGLNDWRVASGLGRIKEVAVAFLGAPNQLVVNAFRYVAVFDAGTHAWQTSLTLLASGSVTLADAKAVIESVAATAGDYDGDGLDELAVATSQKGATTSFDVRLFRMSGTVGKPMTFTQVRDVVVKTDVLVATPTRVQVASGLFTFDPDPAAGWGLLRRQLAVAYRYGGTLNVQTIDLDTALAPVVSAPLTYTVDPGATFAFAAGGFRGALVRPPTPGHDGDPTWSFALLTWQAPRYWGMTVLQPGAMPPAASKPAPFATASMGPELYTVGAPTPASRLALAAADYDGNSIYLGAPMHLVIENFLSADYILEEPPKHTFWNRQTHKVENVNRTDDFYLKLAIGTSRELTSSRTDKVSYALGGSVTATASTTVGAGGDIGIVSASAEVSTEVSASLAYDYSRSESDMNSSFGSVETQSIGATSRDDFILGRIRSFDVWRYRIYGLSTNDEANPFAFFDFVLPAPMKDQVLPSGGAAKNWYHPRHENGNILSYAENSGAFQNPPDRGEVAMNGAAVDARIVRNASIDYGGTTLLHEVKFTDGTTTESSFSYDNDFKANASLKTTASAEASAFGVKTAASGSLAFEAHGSYSWGGTGLNKTTTTKSSGLSLNVPTGTSQYSYTFHPMVYVTGDGAMKATYAVTIPLGGAWENYYSRADLALNLPKRFIVDINDYGIPIWVPYRLTDRKSMKGFFLREEAVNTLTGEYDLIRPEVVPDTGLPHFVRLQANVYNYSIKGVVLAAPTPAKACFHLIEMVESLDAPSYEKELPGPGNLIGCAYLPEIPPRGMVTAEVLWDTQGKSGGTTRDYRIYVRLDPDGVVTENYDNRPDWTETCGMYEFDNDYEPTTECVDIDPGQNNEGYFAIKVVTSVSQGGEGDKHPHVGFKKDAMVGVDRDGRVRNNVRAELNVPLRYRVTVWSDLPSHTTSFLLVYDGEPDRGGELIEMKEVFTGDPRGSTTWFDWTPTRLGSHRLYAKILQKLDDPAPGDNVGTMKVQVLPRPRRPSR